jgi:hypothetical protein
MRYLILSLFCLLACTGKSAPPKSPIDVAELRRSFWKDCEDILKGGDAQGAFLVAEAIDDLGDEAGVSMLYTLAAHEEYFVRSRAAQAFLRFPKSNADAFRPLMEDDIAEVRLWASAVFAARGDAASKKVLEDFLQDPEPLLTQTAASGEDPTGRNFRRGYLMMTASLAMTLASFDKKDVLRQLTTHEYAQVKYPAALALARFGDASVASLLQEGFRGGAISPKESAWLYSIESKPASLESALQVYSIGKMHDQKAVAAIAAYALSKAKVSEVQSFLEENMNDAALETRFLIRWALLTPKLSAPAPKLDSSHFVAPPHSMPESSPHSMPDSAPDSTSAPSNEPHH